MPARDSTEKSDQRRRAVLDAAVTCFARRGFYGTTTQEIAQQAGISQPYVYRLFENKQTLFASAVDHVSDRMAHTLTTLAASPPSTDGSTDAGTRDALQAARTAYGVLIKDRDLMRFLMQANCVADEPLVGDAVRSCYARQVVLVSEIVGGDEHSVRQWFGAGMLDNVVAVLGLEQVDEPWARLISGG
jgi:AcrR family transcriptional regulator